MKQVISPLFQMGICAVGYLSATSSATLAQVTSDGTVNTQVNQNGSIAEITGGETRGSNLFHSFQDFSVPTGNEAFFNNADSISNIFSRVTGDNISNIDGTIRANGSASLFLINPAGIIFGENARLDIGGSFYGSTASSILFEDGEFSAADLENPPLLTVNAPIGLGFRDEPGEIINRSVANNLDGTTLRFDRNPGLQVKANQNLVLLGGDITIEEGNLTALEGSIQLGGLTTDGAVTIDQNGELIFPSTSTKADIFIIGGETNDETSRLNGGNIKIDASSLSINNGEILVGFEVVGTQDGNNGGDVEIDTSDLSIVSGSINSSIGSSVGGNITIKASDSVLLQGTTEDFFGTAIFSTAGSIQIDTKSLTLKDTSSIENGFTSFVNRDSADIIINADSLIMDTSQPSSLNGIFTINDNPFIRNSSRRGNININTSVLSLNRSSILSSQSSSFSQEIGKGADIIINTSSLSLSNSSRINSNTQGESDGGDISINVSNSISLDNSTISSSASTDFDFFVDEAGNFVDLTFAGGDGGNIVINTPSIFLTNNSFVSSGVSSEGNGGNIQINATDIVSLNGNNGEGSGSGIVSSVTDFETVSESNGGNIEINTKSLSIFNKARIESTTQGEVTGIAGDIKIDSTESIEIQGLDTGIFNRTGGSGNSENISINTQSLRISNDAQIGVNNFIEDSFSIDNQGNLIPIFLEEPLEGSGSAGAIDIDANELIIKDRGVISALSIEGEGGNINLQVDDILSLENNSNITATAGLENSPGNGGNINIDSQFIIAFPEGSNDITANAFNGVGGNINIVTEGIFGIQERPQNPLTNDITASSDAGISGNITITTPDINPVQGATELPTNVVEPEQTTQQACQANREVAAKNGLNITGKGGIPAEPGLPLDSLNVTVNGEANPTSAIPAPIETAQGKIQPARGVIVTESGEIILTAYRTNNSGDRIPEGSANCGRV